MMFFDTVPAEASGEIRVIIPSIVANRMVRMDGDDCILMFTENRMDVRVGDFSLATNLIEGVFPNPVDFIPKECNKKLFTNRDVFSSAVRRASAFVSDSSKGGRFSMSRSTGLAIATQSTEFGSTDVRVATKYEGDDLLIGMNLKYLLTCLGGDSEEVTLEFSAPNTPILIRDDSTAKIVMMPVNV